MDIVKLEVQTRDKSLSAKDLLRQDILPMEYYGKGVDNKTLQVDYQTFRKAYRKAGGSTIIEMTVDGKETINVLVHDVQFNPVTDAIEHVDLINVRMGEALHTTIPLEFHGTAPAVKEEGGVLVTHLTEVEVKCLPKDLVHNFEVSIEPLVDFNTYIRVKDLNVPDTIEVLNDPEDVVANVVPPRVEEEPEPAEGEEGAEGAAAEGEAKEGDDAEAKEDSGEEKSE